MTVRQTEAFVRHLQVEQEQPKTTGTNRIDPDIKNLQDKLSGQLGAEVLIKHNAKGKGYLTLKYNSLDELEGILDHIK